MGADKPEVGRNTSKPETSFPLLQILAAVVLVFIGLLQKEDGKEEYKAPKLNPKEQIKLDKRLKEIDDSEQYALVAISDGWYPCNHLGRSTFHLLPGEIWKYGTTEVVRFWETVK
jgi:sulfite exporter TauE/SafE